MAVSVNDECILDMINAFQKTQDRLSSVQRTVRKSRKPKADPISADEWSQHRETIQHLYITQKKTLPEVIQLMKKEHGFTATKKQYKDQFPQWKIHKNIPGFKLRGIAVKDAERCAIGKSSAYTWHGIPVDSIKLSKCKKKLVEAGCCQRTPSLCLTAMLTGLECVTVRQAPSRCRSSPGETSLVGQPSTTSVPDSEDYMEGDCPVVVDQYAHHQDLIADKCGPGDATVPEEDLVKNGLLYCGVQTDYLSMCQDLGWFFDEFPPQQDDSPCVEYLGTRPMPHDANISVDGLLDNDDAIAMIWEYHDSLERAGIVM